MENLDERNIPPADFKNSRNQKTILNDKTKIIAVLAVIVVLGVVFYFARTALKPEGERELQQKAADIIKTKNINECEKINDEMYKTVCRNNIALNFAQEKQDISYCQKIDDKLVPKADCERQVIFVKSIEKEDIRVCGETSNTELQKQCETSFYNQLALKKNDVKICDQISDKEKTNFCYDNFLITKDFLKSKDNFNCALLKSDAVKKDCEALKNNTQGETLCMNLKTSLFLPYCFTKTYAK